MRITHDHRSSFARHQHGFSLVELLVASGIGVILTLLIATVFANSSKTGTVTQTVSEIEEQAGIAIEMLQRDLRQTGFSGCNSNRAAGSGLLVNTIAAPTAYLNNIPAYIQGHEGTSAAFVPVAPAQITGASPAADDASDAVTVRIPSREPVALSATMASANAVIPVFSTAGFAVGTRAMVSDCAQSAAFRVTSLAGGLRHAVGLNSTANLGRAFGIDATAVPFNTVSYYVGASNIAPLGTELSLWRRVEGAAASEELAEGVESFHLLYCVDTDSDLSADLFETADDVADWGQVIAVRASLLMRSKVANAARNPQAYDFNGQTAVAPGDLRMRRAFNVTILLRNRTI